MDRNRGGVEHAAAPPAKGMAPKIFCIGLGRTGTTTFQECMARLGFRHRGWRGPYLVALARLDVTAIFPVVHAYDSFDDYPFPLIYKDLDRHFPGSKFVLTRRENAGVWADSVAAEFFRKGFTESDQMIYGETVFPDNRLERLQKMYDGHMADVRKHFRDRADLLEICWEAGDGWVELCEFLQVPVPKEELPHANRRDREAKPAVLDRHCERSRYAAALRFVEHWDDPALRSRLKEHLLMKAEAEGPSALFSWVRRLGRTRKRRAGGRN